MTEEIIQNAIFKEYRRKKYEHIVPNIYLFGWESDIVAISNAGLINEFEIKVSLSDFKSEFTTNSKRKKKRLRNLRNKSTTSKYSKYLKSPNYFWFATSPGLLENDMDMLPEYSGLMEINQDEEIEIVKSAPRLHTKKLHENQNDKLSRGLMLRYWRERLNLKRV